MSIADSIHRKLTERLAPQRLEIEDQSERHRGHKGYREGGESHFALKLVSAAFEGLSRLERHRLIHDTLAAELAGPIHALQLDLKAPSETTDH